MRCRHAAFSLLEIILAAFLFSGVVTVLSIVWTLHARAQAKSASLMVAADLADMEMERTLALGYHNAVSTTASYQQVWEVRGEAITHTFDTEVDVQVIIDPTSTSLPGFKAVAVTVLYDDFNPDGGRRRFVIRSYMTEEA